MRAAMSSAFPAAAVMMFASPAPAQAPVALVEEVRGNPVGVALMDYVPIGKVIQLGSRDSIVLGYLTSCWHETITGGTVIVYREQSDVHGGTVTRTKVMCDGGKIALTPRLANQSAGTSFRGADEEPPLTLYGLFPVIEAPAGAVLAVVRTDRPGEHHTATLPARPGTRRSFFDFAAVNKTLTAGGTYRASIGSREIVFRVDADAKARGVPIIGRLLRFPPAS
jgi:hypothetical protein